MPAKGGGRTLGPGPKPDIGVTAHKWTFRMSARGEVLPVIVRLVNGH